jgi:hypothetical protein
MGEEDWSRPSFRTQLHAIAFAFGVTGAVLIVYGQIMAVIKTLQDELMKNHTITLITSCDGI